MASKWRNALIALRSSNSLGRPTVNPVPAPRHPIVPLPQHITAQLATELFELILDFLSPLPDAAQTLVACALVCRAWRPRSQHLLERLRVVRPRAFAGIVHGGYGSLLCATMVPGLTTTGAVVYGATDGVYLGGGDGSRTRLAIMRNVARVEVFPDVDLFVCLADSALVSIPLRALLTRTHQDDFRRYSKNLIYLSVLRSTSPGEPHRIVGLKSSALSGTIKVFDIVAAQNGGASLVLTWELYIPLETTSIRFLSRTRVAAALKGAIQGQGGFEMLDLTSGQTQSLLDPADGDLAFAFASGARRDGLGRPITVFRVAGHFLLCYERTGFFIDRHGHLAADFGKFQWNVQAPSAFVYHAPYLLVFAAQLIEVWDIESGKIVQTVRGVYLPLNMPEEEHDAVLVLDLRTKELTELEFPNLRR